MKPFEQLTIRGRLKRLRSLAIDALKHYDFDVRQVRLVGRFTNTLFRVSTVDGGAFALRVCTPGWRTDTDLQSEALWLNALASDPEIGAPRILPARDGRLIVISDAAGVPEPRRCILMSWLPGIPLGKRLNQDNLIKMGVLFARLHRFSRGFMPPAGFTQRRMDRIFARGEPDVLFGKEFESAFTPENRVVFERTRQQVETTCANLYADPAGLIVIHNDLWHDNIKLYRGRLYPFDFEDTVWGYPVQDIAMALQDLMSDTSASEFEGLQAAFRHGYESLEAWPESYTGQIDTLRAGRLLWVANYVARFEQPYLAKHIERVAPLLQHYLETGTLRKLEKVIVSK